VPTFTIVIPTYGRPEFLAEAISSVLAQSFTDFECVVVDDASPEPASLPPDPRLRLIRRECNGGPPAARNTGIDAARGEYVAFLDDDDVWEPGRLEHAIEAHERAPIAVCLQSTIGAHEATMRRVLEGDVSDVLLDGIIPHLGATTVERTRVLRFDERYEASDDVEWWLRMVRAGLHVATASYVGLLYRVHAGYRPRTGAEKRLANGYMLLREHEDWFADHPRAKAFRFKRMGLYASRLGHRREALALLASSLRLDPKLKTVGHVARAAVARPNAEPAD
jgi:glycosyltransferase involved in cell wall biosynthesis